MARNASKLANLSKTSKSKKYLNIKSGLLCFTFDVYEVCLKSIGTVCFAQTTLATVIKALFFKMAQCLVVVKM